MTEGQDTFPAMLRRLAARFTPRTIVDVGASDGRWSRMAREIWPEANLLLFEPNPIFYPKRTALKYEWSSLTQLQFETYGGKTCDIVRALCSSQSGEATVRMNFSKPYQGVYELGDQMHEAGAPEVVTVPVSTIDAEVARLGLPGPFLVKLDTHGREHEILAGARETLKNTGALVIEVYTWSQGPNSMRAADLVPAIEMAHGFLPSDLCDPLRRPYDGRMVQYDLLLEPRTAAGMDVQNLW